MNDLMTNTEFGLFRDYIETHSGIHLEPQKMYLLESRLTALMVENGCMDFSGLYHKALSDKTGALRDKIIDAMTTHETLWFRDAAPFEILRELLAEYAGEIRKGTRARVRIWSAACSTGQEPYSIAMTVLETARNRKNFSSDNIELLATDISPSTLFMAQAGRYDAVAIERGLSQTMRDRYFSQNGRAWIIGDHVKKMVTFKKMNLQDGFAPLGSFDIVFCRNVIIYLSENLKRDIFHRLAATLTSNGYLFVGASESVASYCREFTMIKHANGIFYQVKQKKEAHI